MEISCAAAGSSREPTHATLANRSAAQSALGCYPIGANDAIRAYALKNEEENRKDRAIDITSARIQRYAVARQDEGAAPATIQYELAIAKRAFSVAIRAEQLAQRPTFPVIHVSNARTGFFEESDFAALQVELPDCLRSVIAFAYYTGWRIPSEILRLTWKQVDFEAGIVRLETGTTKNREGRVFPFAALPDSASCWRDSANTQTAGNRKPVG